MVLVDDHLEKLAYDDFIEFLSSFVVDLPLSHALKQPN